MLDCLGTAYFATISLFLYLFSVSFQTELRPRWPCSRSDSNKDPSCNGPVTHQITYGTKRPPAGMVRKFGEGVPAQVLSLSPANGSK
ncbi:hypothetical protein AVEN_12964-1 [Araneus ventricosus]|uniref:Uncharacterized protein n=1 Tax=Araneus ventricosus TaxID=182803 RepID=A0A4Y2VSA6_ARAVE|nr:hypothetical protein AVEN_12964-1 [Araneus ventricosus]